MRPYSVLSASGEVTNIIIIDEVGLSTWDGDVVLEIVDMPPGVFVSVGDKWDGLKYIPKKPVYPPDVVYDATTNTWIVPDIAENISFTPQ